MSVLALWVQPNQSWKPHDIVHVGVLIHASTTFGQIIDVFGSKGANALTGQGMKSMHRLMEADTTGSS
jgi:hypothetical protein